MFRALGLALAATLRFLRDDPIGFVRVLVVRLVDGKAAAGDELDRRRPW